MTESSADHVLDRLRTAITSFELPPGETLAERGLEVMLDVSRTPIRAALQQLEREGLVRRGPRGWTVTPVDLAEIRQLAEFREAVEATAVALAVERASAADLEALAESITAAAPSDEPGQGLRDGTDFHVALAHRSGNAFLADGVRRTLAGLARTRWLEAGSTEARQSARAEHLAILDAVLARDAELARSLVVAHSRGTRDRLVAVLEAERRRHGGRGTWVVDSTPDR